MTENEKRLNKLIDSLIDLVDIVEYSETISRKEFLELDSAGTEIIDCIEELKTYRAIGTVEEFKALKEKNEPKELYEHNFQDEVHHYLCPSCRSIVSCNQNYCDECGQALET